MRLTIITICVWFMVGMTTLSTINSTNMCGIRSADKKITTEQFFFLTVAWPITFYVIATTECHNINKGDLKSDYDPS